MKRSIPHLYLHGFAAAIAASLFLITTLPAYGQDNTFTITVANKSAEHPLFGQGWNEAYLVNGAQGPALTLTRGVTYTFQMSNVPAIHPFYISTSQTGGGVGAYNDGVQGNFVSGNGTLTFTPPESAPDLLYYQCQAHALMGGVLNIVSGTTSDEAVADLPRTILLEQNYPNPFNPSTSIRFATPTAGHVTLRVFDVMGRELAVLVDGLLAAGTHEVAWDGTTGAGEEVKSGVYVYRIETESETRARAMTLLR